MYENKIFKRDVCKEINSEMKLTAKENCHQLIIQTQFG
jgi:hypothetical protein